VYITSFNRQENRFIEQLESDERTRLELPGSVLLHVFEFFQGETCLCVHSIAAQTELALNNKQSLCSVTWTVYASCDETNL